MTTPQSGRVLGVRRPTHHFHADGTPPCAGCAPVAAEDVRGDAATLRAAAAVVEAREATAPHLVGLRNRLLTLAAQVAPARPDDQEEASDG